MLNSLKLIFSNIKSSVVFIGIIALLYNRSAFAYIDPGAGSIIFQGLIAGAVAGLFYIKTIWYRIKAFFKGETYEASSLDDELDVEAEDQDPPK